MSRVSPRGITMSKITHVRQALHQICADEHDGRTMTARIMAEHDVTTQDVMDACDVVTDVVAQARNAQFEAARHAS